MGQLHIRDYYNTTGWLNTLFRGEQSLPPKEPRSQSQLSTNKLNPLNNPSGSPRLQQPLHIPGQLDRALRQLLDPSIHNVQILGFLCPRPRPELLLLLH